MNKTAAVTAALILTTLPLSATAQVLSGLTPAQAAAVEAEVAQKRADNVRMGVNSSGGVPVAQRVNEWVQVGQGIGAGLASAARELGVVANDFAKTPVGQITIAVIIWKVMGGDLTQLFVGLLWYACLIPIWLTFYRKLWAPVVTIKYDPTTSKKVSKTTTPADINSDARAGYTLSYLLVLGVILLVGLPIIFA